LPLDIPTVGARLLGFIPNSPNVILHFSKTSWPNVVVTVECTGFGSSFFGLPRFNKRVLCKDEDLFGGYLS